MPVYVVNMFMRKDVKNGGRLVRGTWCHMMADTHDELETMARAVGLRPEWIQYPGTYKEHYDVTKERRAAAVKNGAVELPIGPEWRDFLTRKRLSLPAPAVILQPPSETPPSNLGMLF